MGRYAAVNPSPVGGWSGGEIVSHAKALETDYGLVRRSQPLILSLPFLFLSLRWATATSPVPVPAPVPAPVPVEVGVNLHLAAPSRLGHLG